MRIILFEANRLGCVIVTLRKFVHYFRLITIEKRKKAAKYIKAKRQVAPVLESFNLILIDLATHEN